jgi:hypothetical protein
MRLAAALVFAIPILSSVTPVRADVTLDPEATATYPGFVLSGIITRADVAAVRAAHAPKTLGEPRLLGTLHALLLLRSCRPKNASTQFTTIRRGPR